MILIKQKLECIFTISKYACTCLTVFCHYLLKIYYSFLKPNYNNFVFNKLAHNIYLKTNMSHAKIRIKDSQLQNAFSTTYLLLSKTLSFKPISSPFSHIILWKKIMLQSIAKTKFNLHNILMYCSFYQKIKLHIF